MYSVAPPTDHMMSGLDLMKPPVPKQERLARDMPPRGALNAAAILGNKSCQIKLQAAYGLR